VLVRLGVDGCSQVAQGGRGVAQGGPVAVRQLDFPVFHIAKQFERVEVGHHGVASLLRAATVTVVGTEVEIVVAVRNRARTSRRRQVRRLRRPLGTYRNRRNQPGRSLRR